MFSGVSEGTRTFSFRSRNQPDSREETLNIHVFDVQDQSQARYSSYIWPSAPILAIYLWEHRHELSGKHILELGAGTALPGILAAKCGAYVTLSESALLPKSIQDLERSCKLNNLNSSQVQVIGLTWGLFTYSVLQLKPVDLIISSDCFYEPITFEDIIATVAFLLEKNPRAKFLSTYQERSADWSIEHLLNKWNLRCDEISIDNLVVDLNMSIRAAHKVFVSNLPWTVSQLELKKYFSEFGHVTFASVIFDRDTGLSKGYGFVTYSTKSGADAVINKSNHFLEGNQNMNSEDDLAAQFDRASDYVMHHHETLGQDTLMDMYGYFKRATVGPCNIPKPSWFDFSAKIKWKSWNNCSYLSKLEAMRKYVECLDKAVEDWRSDSNTPINGIFVSSMCTTDQVLLEDQKTVFDWIKEGDLDKLKTKQFDPNSKDDEGLALLHWAADRGDLQIVRYLVEVKKANLNCLDSEGQTPLHYAAACGYPDVVQCLINAGADSKLTDNDNNTPKDVAENDSVAALFS